MRDVKGNVREKENVWKPAKQFALDMIQDAGQEGIERFFVIAALQQKFDFEHEDSPEYILKVLERKENRIHSAVESTNRLLYGPRLWNIVIKSENMNEKPSVLNKKPNDLILEWLADGPMKSIDIVHRLNETFNYANKTRPYAHLEELKKRGLIEMEGHRLGNKSRTVSLKKKVENMTEIDYNSVPSLQDENQEEERPSKTRFEETIEKAQIGVLTPQRIEPLPQPAEIPVEKPVEVDAVAEAEIAQTRLTVASVLESFDKELDALLKKLNPSLKAKLNMAITLTSALGYSAQKNDPLGQREVLKRFLEEK